MNCLIFKRSKLFIHMIQYLFHFDIAVDNYEHIREYSRPFSNVLIQLLRIDKYLRIFSMKTDFFFNMAPKKKEHSNDLRTLVINHYLNDDSQREIAKKMLFSRPTVQSIIKRYKNTKCIGNLFGLAVANLRQHQRRID